MRGYDHGKQGAQYGTRQQDEFSVGLRGILIYRRFGNGCIHLTDIL